MHLPEKIRRAAAKLRELGFVRRANHDPYMGQTKPKYPEGSWVRMIQPYVDLDGREHLVGQIQRHLFDTPMGQGVTRRTYEVEFEGMDGDWESADITDAEFEVVQPNLRQKYDRSVDMGQVDQLNRMFQS